MRKILNLLSIMVFLAFLPQTISAQSTNKEITLEDIWTSRLFYPKFGEDMTPMKDGEHYSKFDDDGISLYDYKKGSRVKVIAESDSMNVPGTKDPIIVETFAFSGDEKKILLSSESEPIYRYSEKSQYYIFNIATKNMLSLSDNGKQRLAEFSPDGSKVAFTRDNNLFVKDIVSGKETPITSDGKNGSIINGSTDWVYEEEFDLVQAYFWSPDGNKIAFYKFDESNVKEYTIVMYDSLYPENFTYKYPKAGEDNSIINLFIYDLPSGKTQQIDLGPLTDQYIPRIYWTKKSDTLAILRMNRLQNHLEMLLADAGIGKSSVVWTEDNKYYVDITDNLYFLEDKNHFIITSERSQFNHIWMFSLDGKDSKQITTGDWEVASICSVDEKNKTIYYISSESSPMDRDLYSIKFDGTGKTKLSTKSGQTKAQFTPKNKYYISTWSDANTPPAISLCDTKGKVIRVIEDNTELIKNTKEYKFSPKEFFQFTTSEGVKLNGWMIKPPDFNGLNHYPVFMYVYGGPGSQTVENSWGYFDYVWYEMLAEKGYIVVSIDNRGTGARGEEFKKCTYLQMGKYETIDQIEAAKYLSTLPYVDGKRIGIWGWSYGGYETALCMTKGADVFKMGIAVAPVTNWRYYDNIYTERFMRTPQENADGYDDNSPLNFAKKLKGKFLLVHGTADDNVHMQNSMELAEALVNANKQFEMQFYPNKNHSIYGGYTRLHLFKRMTDFILENL
jgi:dipeptidyl-peptidase 4